jgi:hypothetical protein
MSNSTARGLLEHIQVVMLRAHDALYYDGDISLIRHFYEMFIP